MGYKRKKQVKSVSLAPVQEESKKYSLFMDRRGTYYPGEIIGYFFNSPRFLAKVGYGINPNVRRRETPYVEPVDTKKLLGTLQSHFNERRLR